jgi:hypothetical protein
MRRDRAVLLFTTPRSIIAIMIEPTLDEKVREFMSWPLWVRVAVVTGCLAAGVAIVAMIQGLPR